MTSHETTTGLARPALVIFDMDGVLLELPLETERVRDAIRVEFAKAGIHRPFRPLLATLQQTCAELQRADATRAATLRRRAWALIDAEEQRAAPRCRALPGAAESLERLTRRGIAVALFTNNSEAAARSALERAGIDPQTFVAIAARREARSLKPAGEPVLELVAAARAKLGEPVRTVYLIGDHPVDMRSARLAETAFARRTPDAAGLEPAPQLVPIAMLPVQRRADPQRAAELEEAGATFLAADLDEVLTLISARPTDQSLSVVLLAFNEAARIADAIGDARRFCRLFAPDGYEVIVVDDGSSDDTAAVAEAASEGDVVLVRHSRNLGMGAAMRSGYLAARMQYIFHLPGDRQVRPQSLAAVLPLLAPHRVALTHYCEQPSGRGRGVVSSIFRLLVRHAGGLRVNFAGTYVFHRGWLEQIDLARIGSQTFMFSFELLEQMRRGGGELVSVPIHNFRREVGQSRVFSPRRIGEVFGEIVACRLRHTLARLGIATTTGQSR